MNGVNFLRALALSAAVLSAALMPSAGHAQLVSDGTGLCDADGAPRSAPVRAALLAHFGLVAATCNGVSAAQLRATAFGNLDLSGIGITEMTPGEFRNLNVTGLDLSDNQIEELPLTVFDPLRNTLTTLDLSDNDLRLLGFENPFNNLNALHTLDLSDNANLVFEGGVFRGVLDTLGFGAPTSPPLRLVGTDYEAPVQVIISPGITSNIFVLEAQRPGGVSPPVLATVEAEYRITGSALTAPITDRVLLRNNTELGGILSRTTLDLSQRTALRPGEMTLTITRISIYDRDGARPVHAAISEALVDTTPPRPLTVRVSSALAHEELTPQSLDERLFWGHPYLIDFTPAGGTDSRGCLPPPFSVVPPHATLSNDCILSWQPVSQQTRPDNQLNVTYYTPGGAFARDRYNLNVVGPALGLCFDDPRARSPVVRNEIFRQLGVDADACHEVTAADLAGVTELDFSDGDIGELLADDFAELSGLLTLALDGNRLARLPPGIFATLPSLTTLDLADNRLGQLADNLFNSLHSLNALHLEGNPDLQLPDTALHRVLDTLGREPTVRAPLSLDGTAYTVPATMSVRTPASNDGRRYLFALARPFRRNLQPPILLTDVRAEYRISGTALDAPITGEHIFRRGNPPEAIVMRGVMVSGAGDLRFEITSVTALDVDGVPALSAGVSAAIARISEDGASRTVTVDPIAPGPGLQANVRGVPGSGVTTWEFSGESRVPSFFGALGSSTQGDTPSWPQTVRATGDTTPAGFQGGDSVYFSTDFDIFADAATERPEDGVLLDLDGDIRVSFGGRRQTLTQLHLHDDFVGSADLLGIRLDREINFAVGDRVTWSGVGLMDYDINNLRTGVDSRSGTSGDGDFFASRANPVILRAEAVTDSVPAVRALSINSTPAAGGIYQAGETIEATVTLTEAVSVDTGILSDAPTLTLDVGGQARTMTYAADRSDRHRLVFTYAVTAADYDGDGVSIAADALSDPDGVVANALGTPLATALNALAADTDQRVNYEALGLCAGDPNPRAPQVRDALLFSLGRAHTECAEVRRADLNNLAGELDLSDTRLSISGTGDRHHFADLHALTGLDLSDNQLGSLLHANGGLPGVFDDLHALTHLDLSGNLLLALQTTRLPVKATSLGEVLDTLESLDLSGTQFDPPPALEVIAPERVVPGETSVFTINVQRTSQIGVTLLADVRVDYSISGEAVDDATGEFTVEATNVVGSGAAISSETIEAMPTASGEFTVAITGLTPLAADGSDITDAAVADSLINPVPLAAEVTIPANDPPDAVDDTATVDEGGTVVIDVLANDSDTETADADLTVSIHVQPQNGEATVNDDGTIGYTHDGSETTGDQIPYLVTDTDTHNPLNDLAVVTVTVTPVNDPPTADITAPAAGAIFTSNSVLTLTAEGTDAEDDPAGAALTYQWSATAADAAVGTFTNPAAAAASWTHSVTAATDVTFTATVTDSGGASTADTREIILSSIGNTEGGFIGAVSGVVTEDSATNPITGTMTVIDPDPGEAMARAQTGTVGDYGVFDLAANGVWTYSLDNDDPDTDALVAGMFTQDILPVTSLDGGDDRVIITVNGANDAPMVAIESPLDGMSAPLGSEVAVVGVGGDVDGDPLTYAWSASGGDFAAAASRETVWRAPAEAGDHTLTLSVSDGNGADSSATVAVRLAMPPSLPPLVDMNYELDAELTAFTLLPASDGVAPYTYTLGASNGNLPAGLAFNPATRVLSGTPTANGIFALDYTVADANGLTATSSFHVTIRDPDNAPQLTGVAITSTPLVGNTYRNGEVIRVTVSYDAEVSVDLARGRPRMVLVDGFGSRSMLFERVSGPGRLEFAYTVEPNAGGGIHLPANQLFDDGGAIRDSEGRRAFLAYDRVESSQTIINEPDFIGGDLTGVAVELGTFNNDISESRISGEVRVFNPQNTFTSLQLRPLDVEFVAVATDADNGYGGYVLEDSGDWRYNLHNDNAEVNALNPGETLTDTFTVTTENIQDVGVLSAVVTITINGAADRVTFGDGSIDDAHYYGDETGALGPFPTAEGGVGDLTYSITLDGGIPLDGLLASRLIFNPQTRTLAVIQPFGRPHGLNMLVYRATDNAQDPPVSAELRFDIGLWPEFAPPSIGTFEVGFGANVHLDIPRPSGGRPPYHSSNVINCTNGVPNGAPLPEGLIYTARFHAISGVSNHITGLNELCYRAFDQNRRMVMTNFFISVIGGGLTPGGGGPGSGTAFPFATTATGAGFTSTPIGGVYGIGDTIQATLSFFPLTGVNPNPVTVTAAADGSVPNLIVTLSSDVGVTQVFRPMQYVGALGVALNELVFEYNVAEGDFDADGVNIGPNTLQTNGASIVDGNGDGIALEHGQFAGLSGHRVDGVRPTASAQTADATTVAVSFTEPVTIGTPAAADFTLSAGGAAIGVQSAAADGQRILLTLAQPLDGGVALTLGIAAGVVTDTVGNDNDALGVSVTNTLADDLPVITGIGLSAPAAGGAYQNGETITFSVTFSDPLTVTPAGNGDTPQLVFTLGALSRPAGFAGLTNGDHVMSFTYSVVPADVGLVAVDANALSLNGATITDAAGNPATVLHAQSVAPDTSRVVANDPAVIGGALTATVDENAEFAEGLANAVDPDGANNDFVVVDNSMETGDRRFGGVWSINGDGLWRYTLDNQRTEINSLTPGDPPVVDTFVIATADGATATVSVTIEPADDVSVIFGVLEHTLSEDTAEIDGDLGSVDPDDNDDLFDSVPTLTPSTHGAYTINRTGMWTYSLNRDSAAVNGLNAAGTLTDTFAVSTEDLTATATITLTITGVNDPADFTGSATEGSVTEAVAEAAGMPETGGALIVDDPDGDDTVLVQTDNPGRFGVFSVTADGDWTYTLNNAAADALGEDDREDDIFVVTETDDAIPPASVTVTVNVIGRNDPPTLTITSPTDNATVAQNSEFNLTAAAADPDSTPTFTWSTTPSGAAGGVFANPAQANTVWTAPRVLSTEDEMTVTLQATVDDGVAPPLTRSVRVRVQPAPDDDDPMVTGVTLADPASGNTYGATEVIRASVVFDEAVTVRPLTGANVPQIATLRIGTESREMGYLSGSGTNTLVFGYPLVVADADGDGVTLSAGSINLPAGAAITDAAGNDAALNYPDAPPSGNARRVADDPPVNLVIQVRGEVPSGARIILIGVATDPEGRPLTFTWTASEGLVQVGESGSVWNAPTVRFGSAARSVMLNMAVSDGVNTATQNLLVSVQPLQATAPVATIEAPLAGDAFASNALVPLRGSATDIDDDPATLTYRWSASDGNITDNDGVDGAWIAPTVAAGAPPLTATLTLTVNDDMESDAVTVVVRVQPIGSAPPTANITMPSASSVTLSNGATIMLVGAGTSSDGTTNMLAYRWRASGNAGTFSAPDATATAWTAPLVTAGTDYTLTFTASDRNGSSRDTLVVTVTPGNATFSGPLTAVADNNGEADGTLTVMDPDGAVNNRCVVVMPAALSDGEYGLYTVDENPCAWTYTVNRETNPPSPFVRLPMGATVTDTFPVESVDRSIARISVSVTGENDPPIANAGPDRVANEAAVVQLDGSRSGDPDDGEDAGNLAYSWVLLPADQSDSTQAGRDNVTLADANTATPTFTAPVDVPTAGWNYVFELTVNDVRGDTDTDTVTIRVSNLSLVDARLVDEVLPHVAREIGARNVNMIAARIESAAAERGLVHGQLTMDGGWMNALRRITDEMNGDGFDAKRLLADGGFVMPYNDHERLPWTLWGEGDYLEFGGDGGGVDWDGELVSVYIGADGRLGNDWLGGVALSWNESEVDYDVSTAGGNDRGRQVLSLTGVHPYIAWDRGVLNLWLTVGASEGEMELTPEDGDKITRDAEMETVGMGFSTERWNGDVALRKHIRLTHSMLTVDPGEGLPGAELEAYRVNAAAEASRTMHYNGSSLTLNAATGFRIDGGDGEGDGVNGAGLEVSAGMRYTRFGLSLELRGHGVSGRSGYKEWGVTGDISLTPAHGYGWSFNLTPSVGHNARSLDDWWDSAGPVAAGDLRMSGELGFGLPWRASQLTPYTGVSVGGGRRDFRVGGRLAPIGGGWHTGLEALRIDRDDDASEHSVILKVNRSTGTVSGILPRP